MTGLLPINSTALERALDGTSAEDLKPALRTLYNPDTCPPHLLYQLAWAWSVDRWDDSWSEAVKRSVIRAAFSVHAHKGTVGALRRVVDPSESPEPTPKPTQTALVRQVLRAQLNALYPSPADPAVLVAELVLPPEVGGWWIRELALEDANGNFVAVAKPAPSYKPLLAQPGPATRQYPRG
ncbi:phage tail protein, P2 protein I family [Pseudomonas guariconensis]|uniref:phage tail protein I n=1 Tax=Pseudomonas guariconensis TaxID=1288410 RepID=UPI000887A604|nr:phage tail protein I [Pseudomonas guariconensis]SDD76307.1 phage tail protein, P2 protein I family [Pseudomonas guariconensis]